MLSSVALLSWSSLISLCKYIILNLVLDLYAFHSILLLTQLVLETLKVLHLDQLWRFCCGQRSQSNFTSRRMFIIICKQCARLLRQVFLVVVPSYLLIQHFSGWLHLCQRAMPVRTTWMRQKVKFKQVIRMIISHTCLSPPQFEKNTKVGIMMSIAYLHL